jgi:hypothetical protein
MRNKGQAAIFIIFGFVLLTAIGAVFFLRHEKTESVIRVEHPSEPQYAGQVELRNFIDSCLKDSVFNGVEILRLQAGYIDVPAGISTIKVKDPSGEQIVADENGIKKIIIDKNGAGNNVPYWLDSDNKVSIPSEEFVKDSLAMYIKKSVLACVDDFNAFKKQGYSVNAREPNIEVGLSDEIAVNMEYPLVFEKDDVKFEETEFLLNLPINLKKAIELQTDVAIGEYVGSYLESDIKYIISLYSYSGRDKRDYDLPPLTFTEANMNCRMATWTLNEAKRKISANLRQNSKYFKIAGAAITQIDEKDEIKRGVYKGFTSNILSEQYKNADVSFEFYDEDMQFDVKPRQGNLIRPSRHRATNIKFLPLFCSIRYQFKYTMKFPMLARATIDSPSLDVVKKALNENKNFEFAVPIGVFLCGNQNRQCTGKPAYLDKIPKINLTSLNLTEPPESIFCDEEMKKSQPLAIRLVDSYNLDRVDDATLFYRCGLGENDCLVDVSDKNGEINAKLPLCENGELYIIKENYSESPRTLSTYPGDETKQVDYLVEPLKEVEVEIKLVDLPLLAANYYMSNGFKSNRCTGQKAFANDANIGVQELTNENVIITSNIGPSQIALLYPQDKKVKIASGRYSLAYIAEGKVEIDPSTIKYGNGTTEVIGATKEGKPYTGAYLLGNYNDFRVNLDIDQLKAAKKIVIYVPKELSSSKVEIKDMGLPIIQPDGSLHKKGMIDDDCDPSTPSKEFEANISKKEFEELLKPRLE